MEKKQKRIGAVTARGLPTATQASGYMLARGPAVGNRCGAARTMILTGERQEHAQVLFAWLWIVSFTKGTNRRIGQRGLRARVVSQPRVGKRGSIGAVDDDISRESVPASGEFQQFGNATSADSHHIHRTTIFDHGPKSFHLGCTLPLHEIQISPERFVQLRQCNDRRTKTNGGNNQRRGRHGHVLLEEAKAAGGE